MGRLSDRLWKAADGIMVVLFGFGAIVQYNDPDPLRWVAQYGTATVACILSFGGRPRWWFPAAVGAVALLWASTLAPGVIGRVPFLSMFEAFEMKNVGIEESREMYGLVVIAGWMAVLSVRSARRTRGSACM